MSHLRAQPGLREATGIPTRQPVPESRATVGPALRLDVVTRAETLAGLSGAWSSLLSRCNQNQPTLTPTWILAWWSVFSGLDGRALRVCALWEGERLVALAPFLLRTHMHFGVLPLRRIELLGSGEAEADEIRSEYVGIVVEPGFEESAAKGLASALAEGSLGAVDECLLPLMNGDDPFPPFLRTALLARGWNAELSAVEASPFVPLPSSWEAYLGVLPSRRRKLLRRAEADLESWAGGTLELQVASNAEGLARGRAILERLHSGRWQAAGEAGVFASHRFTAFHDLVMPALQSLGALELMWLEARSEPAAVLYNIVWDGKVHVYQAGRRVDLPPQLRPGYAIHAHAIRRAIEHGRSEYDFLAGASRYKMDLALATRSVVSLSATRPGARQWTKRIFDRLGASAGRMRRQLGEAPPPSPADDRE